MELIPAISNFLDVSTDELFETDRKAERLQSLLKETYKYHWWDHQTNCTLIEMYRDILKEFPNDYQTMWHLVVRLAHENYDPPGIQSEEIISLCNRIINDSPDLSLRRMTTCSLAQAYKHMGEQEKAVKIIKENPIIHSLSDGIGFSRETTLAYGIAEGEEMWENRRDVMQHLCNELCVSIRHFHLSEEYSTKKDDSVKASGEFLEMVKRKILIRGKINKILDAFYEDGDYGGMYETMLYNYGELAECYLILGENEKALDNIEKCAETAILYDTAEDRRHTSVLVKNLKIHGNNSLANYENHPGNIQYNQSYRVINYWFSGNEYAPIRETNRFKAVIANLGKYAKKEVE
jgi:tetratricopeptide (TPR) repeat protein